MTRPFSKTIHLKQAGPVPQAVLLEKLHPPHSHREALLHRLLPCSHTELLYRQTRQSTFATASQTTPLPAPDPPKPRVTTYDKGIQTIDTIDDPSNGELTEAADNAAAGKPAPATEAEIRARVMREIEMQKEIDKLEEEERIREKELAKNRGLEAADLRNIYASDDFQSFLDHSTKIVERALNDQYDYLKDYRISGDGLSQ